MPFKGYAEVAKEPIILPINGKEYALPEVNIADGIRFTDIVSGTSTEHMSDEEFYRTFLGDVYDQMLADNVPGPAVTRAAATALADFQANRATAEIIWETGADPKGLKELLDSLLPKPNRAQRRSRPTATANTTKTPASTPGTRTSRKS